MARGRSGLRTAGRVALAAAAAAFGVVAYVWATLPDVRPLATRNPETTAFMELRARDAAAAGRTVKPRQRWVRYSRISPHLKRAVLVAEDSAFWDHEGIDVEQIKQSIQTSIERGVAPRGASTITQQLAKNLYLSPSRDPLRKIRELVITRRLEAELSKARIFEIYLNVIEWGDNVWGAEAAARAYFGVSAAALSREQAALLAGAIINPRIYNPARPPSRLLRRQRIILARMGTVEPPAPVLAATPSPPAPGDSASIEPPDEETEAQPESDGTLPQQTPGDETADEPRVEPVPEIAPAPAPFPTPANP